MRVFSQHRQGKLHPLAGTPTHPAGTPTRKDAHQGLSPALYAASGRRIRHRICLVWREADTPSGRREEVLEFSRPDHLLDLVRRISTTPDRPLISARLQAKVIPAWEDVGIPFLLWRVAERERRGGAR